MNAPFPPPGARSAPFPSGPGTTWASPLPGTFSSPRGSETAPMTDKIGTDSAPHRAADRPDRKRPPQNAGGAPTHPGSRAGSAPGSSSAALSTETPAVATGDSGAIPSPHACAGIEASTSASPQSRTPPPATAAMRAAASAGAFPPRLLFLRAARLMAGGGVNDAHAASLMLGWFGQGYRRPLVLMRALLLEMSRVSNRQIQLAPPCCGRITRDEALILRALGREETEFRACHADANELLETDGALGAATCFQAVSACFEDMGAPLR